MVEGGDLIASPLAPVLLPGGSEVQIWQRRYGPGAGDPGRNNRGGRRVAIVAGLRGDTPEGVRICHAVGRCLERLEPSMRGTVDLFPCLNPLAAHQSVRMWPSFDLDLNRRFPGRADGHAPDRVIAALVAALDGAEQVIVLKGAQPAFRESPQAQVWAGSRIAADRARWCNVEVLWRQGTAEHDSIAEGSLRARFPDAIELEGGCGNRLTEGVGDTLRDGILNLLSVLEVIPDTDLPFHWATIQRPRTVQDASVLRLRAGRGGLFHPMLPVGSAVGPGEIIGEVVDPISGELLEEIAAPERGSADLPPDLSASGAVLAIREQPVVLPGTLVARLVLPERK